MCIREQLIRVFVPKDTYLRSLRSIKLPSSTRQVGCDAFDIHVRFCITKDNAFIRSDMGFGARGCAAVGVWNGEDGWVTIEGCEGVVVWGGDRGG